MKRTKRIKEEAGKEEKRKFSPCDCIARGDGVISAAAAECLNMCVYWILCSD